MGYITVVSWRNLNNAGDEVIGTITGELLHQRTGYEIRQIQLYPGSKDYRKEGIYLNITISNAFLAISKIIFNDDIKYPIKRFAYGIRLKKYFRKVLRESKAVVYAVGMLKFASQNQSFFFEIINDVAQEYQIPIIISGVSVAKPDLKDWRFKQLKETINIPNVKMITTRDGEKGKKLLSNYYITNPDIMIKSVGDIALLLKDFYDTTPRAEKHHVGVGLIRRDIFRNYGKEINNRDLFNVYSELIDILEDKQIDWQLFSNGMKEDYEFGRQIIQKKHLPEERLAENPKDAAELISIINSFDAVIAARLHASIISTALNKPVTGFYWEDKVRCFVKETHQEDYYLEVEQLSANNLYQNYLKVVDSKKDIDRINYLQQCTLSSFDLIGEIICGNE